LDLSTSKNRETAINESQEDPFKSTFTSDSSSNRGSNLNSVEKAKLRIIMITVDLSYSLTQDDYAYKTLLDAIIQLHNSSSLYPDDLICYNIGAPLLSKYLLSDC